MKALKEWYDSKLRSMPLDSTRNLKSEKGPLPVGRFDPIKRLMPAIIEAAASTSGPSTGKKRR